MRYNIQQHIQKSIERFEGEDYSLDKIFQPRDYQWQGDYEGRCLLAFCNLNEISCGDFKRDTELFRFIVSKTNGTGCFGEKTGNVIEEQKLAGHSWLLRGLMEYYKLHNDKKALLMAENIVETLYLPIIEKLNSYIIPDYIDSGEVSGNNFDAINGWVYSSDKGCLFIAIDGLSEYYVITQDKRVWQLLKSLVEKYKDTEFLHKKIQTHATLTALRGIFRLYIFKKNNEYLRITQNIFNLYIRFGMTSTFCNFNWFSRMDTWTEPCAIVDSLIVAILLYQTTKEEKYRKMARRICFNGLSHSHRSNGGAGPDSCVTKKMPMLKIVMFEAKFCCSMRYCEGLKFIFENKELFVDEDTFVKLSDGRELVGDILRIKEILSNKEMLLTDISFPTETDKEYEVVF